MTEPRYKVNEEFLAEYNSLLAAGDRKKARAFLYSSYTAEPDRDVRRWMREVQKDRLAEAKAPKKPKKVQPPKPVRIVTAKCSRCGLKFEYRATEEKTTPARSALADTGHRYEW